MNEERSAMEAQYREALILALSSGRPLSPEVQAHLATCASCREEWVMLVQLQEVLLGEAALPSEALPPLALPTAMRADLLSRAVALEPQTAAPPPRVAPQNRSSQLTSNPSTPRQPGARGVGAGTLRWLPRVMLGAAAAAALIVGALLLTPPGQARALPDPAVVVNAGGPLLVASNGGLPRAGTQAGHTHQARLTLITGEQVTATLDVDAPSPAWFTEGVRLGETIYLADAGNDRVLEVQTRPLRLLRSVPVSGGVAGLSAGGGRVYFKSVSGEAGVLPTATAAGRTVALAREGHMPMPDVMDAVLLQAGTLYVTHHLRGELCLLDPATLAVRRRIRLGGAPVALAGISGAGSGAELLVLDVTGRLLRLDAAGAVLQSWKLPGQPDKLVLNAGRAVVTDRAGGVTQLDLSSGVLTRVVLKHPMDVAVTADGHVAVAQGQTGVALLGDDLKPMPGGEIR